MADPISKTLTQKVSRPDYNVREGWIVVPKFPPSDPRYVKTGPEGDAGVYQITFVLGIPGKNVFRDHVAMGQTHLDGDSLLLFPNKVETFEVRFDDRGSTIGTVMLGHNSDRRLSTATMRIQANSLVEAEQAAYMETSAEDHEIALRMDAGRRALYRLGRNETGPYQSPMEDGMQHFHEYLRRELGPHL